MGRKFYNLHWSNVSFYVEDKRDLSVTENLEQKSDVDFEDDIKKW